MKKSINAAARSVTFTFEGLDSVTFYVDNASRANQDYAALHGFSARIGDNAAFSKVDFPSGVTEAMRRAAVLEITEHYNSGSADWNLKARAAKAAPQNPTIAAIAVKLGCSYEEAQAKVAEQFLASIK